MALAKLQITVVHTGESFAVQFNPEEYSLSQENNFANQPIPGLSGPLVQFVAGNASKLDMELFFDTWDSPDATKRDVRDEVAKVTNLLKIDRDLHAPPVLDVEWGSLTFRCVLTSASQNRPAVAARHTQDLAAWRRVVARKPGVAPRWGMLARLRRRGHSAGSALSGQCSLIQASSSEAGPSKRRSTVSPRSTVPQLTTASALTRGSIGATP